MSVTDADDADQPYEQVNGEFMDQMHQAAQDLPDPPSDD